jgi:hypothetical protein
MSIRFLYWPLTILHAKMLNSLHQDAVVLPPQVVITASFHLGSSPSQIFVYESRLHLAAILQLALPVIREKGGPTMPDFATNSVLALQMFDAEDEYTPCISCASCHASNAGGSAGSTADVM